MLMVLRADGEQVPVVRITKTDEGYCWQANTSRLGTIPMGTMLAQGGFQSMQEVQLAAISFLKTIDPKMLASLQISEPPRGLLSSKRPPPRQQRPKFVSTVRETGNTKPLFRH